MRRTALAAGDQLTIEDRLCWGILMMALTFAAILHNKCRFVHYCPLQQNVSLEGCLLKPQMVIPGAEYAGPRPPAEDVAHHTLALVRRVVPPAIPGIMFLSGGQSEEVRTMVVGNPLLLLLVNHLSRKPRST